MGNIYRGIGGLLGLAVAVAIIEPLITKVRKKLKKEKFEVCFGRSMKGLKRNLDTVESEVPTTKKVTKKLRGWKLKKMYDWEKKLGRYAHSDLKHNW